MLEIGQLLFETMSGLIAGIVVSYAVARVVTLAYFRSRMEYDQFVVARVEHENSVNQFEGVSNVRS